MSQDRLRSYFPSRVYEPSAEMLLNDSSLQVLTILLLSLRRAIVATWSAGAFSYHGRVQRNNRKRSYLTMGASIDISGAHYKTELNEYCQKKRHLQPIYFLEGEQGPPHNRQFLASVSIDDGSYQGLWKSSIKDAEASAAKEALASIFSNLEVKTLQANAASGKHGSKAMLNEYCQRNNFELPVYHLEYEMGPPHKRRFLASVSIEDVSYQGAWASSIKDAQAAAAKEALASISSSIIARTSDVEVKTLQANAASGKPASKAMLNEYCQRNELNYPVYRLEHEIGPPHNRSFLSSVLVGNATYEGDWMTSIKDAQASAAERAFDVIVGHGTSLAEFRESSIEDLASMTMEEELPAITGDLDASSTGTPLVKQRRARNESARNDLSTLCIINGWQLPVWNTCPKTDPNSVQCTVTGFHCTVTMQDGRTTFSVVYRR